MYQILNFLKARTSKAKPKTIKSTANGGSSVSENSDMNN
jgi:hypothetical protein